MRLKTIIILCCYLFCNFSSAQTSIQSPFNLEKIADSIYLNKTGYYKAIDFNTLQDLRQQIISKYTDTSSVNYKTALFKK